MGILPPKRPQITEAECRKILKAKSVPWPAILGIRGYFSKTFEPTGNNRGVYDDCIAVVGIGEFRTYNANTDPSVPRKGVAVLKPGVWRYRKGKHKVSSPLGYMALVQAEKVTVVRDGEGEDTGWFGINVHRGGLNSTSSLGCQTVHPLQWPEFKWLVYRQIDEMGLATIPYVLITEEERRQIASS